MSLTITDRVEYDVSHHGAGTASATRCGWHGINRPDEQCDGTPVESVEIRDAGKRTRWIAACERATRQIDDLPHQRHVA
ncbi:hypothetical protein [Nonomuraea insulae]|uniref:Uncharacterized protein n=1 Tax=Nonomuraea insulae TaxID=1616787 RepID=A0ABW1DBT5_9ACTN